MTFAITSAAFTEGGAIPAKYTCEGGDTSPPLAWTGAPATARSFALIADDPDAPDPAAPKMTYVHWVVVNIPTTVTGLAEDASRKGMPAGSTQGQNGWHRDNYGGPCPPIGRHRYFFKLYALDVVLDGLNNPDKDAVLAAMNGHIVAQAQVMGTYEKAKK